MSVAVQVLLLMVTACVLAWIWLVVSALALAVSHSRDLPTKAGSLSEIASMREALTAWLLLPLAAYAFAIVTNVGTSRLEDAATMEEGLSTLLYGALGVEAVAVAALTFHRRQAGRSRLAQNVHVLWATIDEDPEPWTGHFGTRRLDRQLSHIRSARRQEEEDGRFALDLLGGGPPDWRTKPPLCAARKHLGASGAYLDLTVRDRWSWAMRRRSAVLLLVGPSTTLALLALLVAVDGLESVVCRVVGAAVLLIVAAGYTALSMLVLRLQINLAARKYLENVDVEEEIRQLVAAPTSVHRMG
jgi:hypothetical protein